MIRAEKVSTRRREGRTELALLLEFLRHGDTLVVTGLTASRAVSKTSRILCTCSRNRASPSGRPSSRSIRKARAKAFLDMLGVFAEFETNLRRERQLEGIAAAKARGVYRGRKPSIDPAEIQRLRVEEHLGASAIARQLGIGRASVYRALALTAREPWRDPNPLPRPTPATPGSPAAQKS